MTKRKTLGIVGLVVIACAGFLFFKHGTATAPTAKKTADNTPVFNKSTYSTSDPGSIWIVVNKQRPLSPLAYAPTDLVSVGNGQQLRSEAAAALQQLFSAAAGQKLTLKALSGYRSYATQQTVYAREVASYGQAKADTESARPGYSEHQTGLAIDIGGGGCGIDNCFGQTAEGKWVAANAYKYGFIVRYTATNQAVTGYRAEPWHIRYIGLELSTQLQRDNITTLEEFFGL
jgi:zinc D-Ala-D-Ala carboxypeptidase